MASLKAVGGLKTQKEVGDFIKSLNAEQISKLDEAVCDALLSKVSTELSVHLSNIGKRSILASLSQRQYYSLGAKQMLLAEVKKYISIEYGVNNFNINKVINSYLKKSVGVAALSSYSKAVSGAVAVVASSLLDKQLKAIEGLQLQLVDLYHSGSQKDKSLIETKFKLDDLKVSIIEIVDYSLLKEDSNE